MSFRLRTSLLLVFAIGSIFGCTRHSHPGISSTNVSRVRWAIEKDPETLDWTHCSERVCFSQVALLMEGLTRVEENGSERKVLPDLADSWQTPSPTELAFKLKPGVAWSDGELLTSANFVQGWKLLLSNCRNAPQSARLFPIVNAKAFCENKVPFSQVGIKAPDAHTIVLEFRSPQPFFPMVLSHPSTWPVPGEKPRTGFGPTLGPFLLEKWSRGNALRYVRNPRYHGMPATIAGVDVRIVPSAARRVQLFQEGETDFVQDIPSSITSQIVGNPMLLTEPTATVVALIFNTAKRPFNQPSVRHAFEQSLERNEILRLMHWPHIIADELVPTPGTTSSLSYTFAPKVARELLPESKYDFANGKVNELGQWHSMPKPTLAAFPNDTEREIAQNLQAQWLKNLDVKVDLVPGGPTGKTSSAPPTSPSMALVPLSPDLFTTTHGLELFSSQHQDNRAHWRSKAYDALLASAMESTDPAAISHLLAEAQDFLISKDAVVLPLFYKTRSMLRNAVAQGLRESPLEMWEERQDFARE